MKRYFDWQVAVGLILILLTALFYAVHFFLFRDLHHIFIYFVGDVAFVFFEVLLITLVIHRLLHHREKVSTQKKLNMLKGAFFSEVGTDLLRRLVAFEGDTSRIGHHLEEDIKRVYHLLISSWMDFIQHLNVNYPYLHSLAVRTNPFDDRATGEVK